jgi:hypothetical protein
MEAGVITKSTAMADRERVARTFLHGFDPAHPDAARDLLIAHPVSAASRICATRRQLWGKTSCMVRKLAL